jgi:hypothetical protein
VVGRLGLDRGGQPGKMARLLAEVRAEPPAACAKPAPLAATFGGSLASPGPSGPARPDCAARPLLGLTATHPWRRFYHPCFRLAKILRIPFEPCRLVFSPVLWYTWIQTEIRAKLHDLRRKEILRHRELADERAYAWHCNKRKHPVIPTSREPT